VAFGALNGDGIGGVVGKSPAPDELGVENGDAGVRSPNDGGGGALAGAVAEGISIAFVCARHCSSTGLQAYCTCSKLNFAPHRLAGIKTASGGKLSPSSVAD